MKIIRSKIQNVLLGLGLLCLTAVHPAHAQTAGGGIITGTVQGPKGPEAGVWVIAETKDLLTRLHQDRSHRRSRALPGSRSARRELQGLGARLRPGRFDAHRDETRRATAVTLKAAAAKTPQEAAKVYPGNYWLSLLEPPAKSLFPGTGPTPQGNGTGTRMLIQNHWINSLKSDCNFCHQLGNQLTRTLDDVFEAKPELKTHAEAWEWRLGVGVRGTNMYSVLTTQGKETSLKTFSDWTERIANGEVPPAPPRPKGIERNIVATLWDVGDDHSFMHDQISTDKNHPTVNGGGPHVRRQRRTRSTGLAGPARKQHLRHRHPDARSQGESSLALPRPQSPVDVLGHGAPVVQPALRSGRSAQSHDRQQGPRVDDFEDPRQRRPRPGAAIPKTNTPTGSRSRTAAARPPIYDPKTQKFTLIDTCFSTHHLQFDNDPDETVYFNELSGPIVGWIDTKVYDANPRRAERPSAGAGKCSTPTATEKSPSRGTSFAVRRGGEDSVLYDGDTAGGGTRERRAQRGTQTPVRSQTGYAGQLQPVLVIPSPVDDSVWGISEPYPGLLVRMQRGNNPPVSCKTQIFRVPEPGFDPRGVDIDSNGVVWTGLGRQQPPGQLRRPQMQGSERPRESRRQPVQRRLDALPDHRPQAQRHRHPRRLPLLQLGGSAQRDRTRREHAVRHRIELRFADWR